MVKIIPIYLGGIQAGTESRGTTFDQSYVGEDGPSCGEKCTTSAELIESIRIATSLEWASARMNIYD